MSTKCNHLVPRQEQDKKCEPSNKDSKTHYWIPTGRIEITVNNLLSVDFACKYCNRRTTNFLTNEEYELNKRLLGA
jgi:hypothetical protein